MWINKKVFVQAMMIFLAGACALLIAYFFKLPNYVTAGIFGILSIQATRKETVLSAIKKVISVFLAITISYGFFILIGFNIWALVVVFFVFIFSSWILKIPEPIAPSLVIATHIYLMGLIDYTKTLSWSFVGQELALVLIGISVALIINFIYQDTNSKKIKKNIEKSDNNISDAIKMLSNKLMNISTVLDENNILTTLENDLSNLLVYVKRDADNRFYKEEHYIDYLEVRTQQVRILTRIDNHINHLTKVYDQNVLLSQYLINLSEDISIYDMATGQIHFLDDLMEQMQKSDLPKTRVEFENRATMFVILNELKEFLLIKVRYHLSRQEKKKTSK